MDSFFYRPPTPKAALFDWDGTLVETLDFLRCAHNHVRVHYGLEPWSPDVFALNARRSARETYPEIYADHAQAAQDMLYRYVSENHLAALRPFGSAFDLLSFFRSRAVPIGIVSNKRHDALVREITHLGWGGGNLVQAAVGAGAAYRDKPAPDPVFLALETMNETMKLPAVSGTRSQGGDVWLIGDTETDLICAQAADCTGILISAQDSAPSLARTHGAAGVFSSCATLMAALRDYFFEPQTKGEPERLP